MVLKISLISIIPKLSMVSEILKIYKMLQTSQVSEDLVISKNMKNPMVFE